MKEWRTQSAKHKVAVVLMGCYGCSARLKFTEIKYERQKRKTDMATMAPQTSAQLDNLVRSVRRAAEEEIQNILKHYEAGRRDCESGIYDKWYRYNTWHDGRAYDLGWMERNETVKNENVRFLAP